MSFSDWMKEVDREVEAVVGLPTLCMPDLSWWDWWNDGLSPTDARDCALEEWAFWGDVPETFLL